MDGWILFKIHIQLTKDEGFFFYMIKNILPNIRNGSRCYSFHIYLQKCLLLPFFL